MQPKTATISLPLSFKLADVRSYAVIAVFTALSVITPWVFHQFHLAGATYLPMHFFIFIAALAAGWQAGLIVGVLTPVASFALSGMPAATILPQVMVEVAAYGVIAGLLRQKAHWNVLTSLLGAMVGGRIALLATVSIISAVTGSASSPIGSVASPLSAVWNTIAQSWPGMLAQVAIIPLGFWLYSRLSEKRSA